MGFSMDGRVRFFWIILVFCLVAPGALRAANTVGVTPFSCCDGQFVVKVIDGQSVYQNIGDHIYLYFDIPDAFEFTTGTPVYVRVSYFDEAYGRVGLEYDSTKGDALVDKYVRSETHLRSSRIDSGKFVESYHELLLPKLAGRQNGGADFRLYLEDGGDVPLSVQSVIVQNFPFDSPQFQYVLSKPWLSGYTGPTKDYVDRIGLNHKLMVGYQGWFRTPNDLADKGWIHWCRNGVMIPENFSVDMWPDLSEYEDQALFRAGEVFTGSGKPAYVFSSTTRQIVRRHFQWMRKYNIDGAFLQRFVHPEMSGAWGQDEWVLHHVREAANLEGRIWAIEYDVSQLANESNPAAIIKTDWKWLVDVVKVLDDPRYAREENKPVVFIWGLPFPHTNIDKATANAIVDFFKNDPDYGGNYVIGGLPWWWRTLTTWFDHFQRYDGALAWMPQDQAGYQADYRTLASWGIDYFPHVWPGFSWANLQQQSGNQDYWPREGGEFFWQKIYQALGSGASRLFVGMFDEYDEGTAIMPMTDDPPDPPPSWGRFITNDGKPADWWMLLAGEAREVLLGYRQYSMILPTEDELVNRSNIGSEAWVDLAAIDQNHFLYRTTVDDGNTTAIEFAGRDCRTNTTAGDDLYFYFDLDPAFVYGVSEGLDVTIDVDYYDRDGSVELSLQYDSLTGPYTLHPKIITTKGSGEWRTLRFNIEDAYFGNRQNNGSDFRIRLVQSAKVHLDRIRVFKRTDAVVSCDGDFNLDGDVDGADMAIYHTNVTATGVPALALNFGQTECF
jgi:hypothetical protein